MCRQRPLDSNGSVSPVVLHTRRCDIVALPLALTVVIKLHSTVCVERARTARSADRDGGGAGGECGTCAGTGNRRAHFCERAHGGRQAAEKGGHE